MSTHTALGSQALVTPIPAEEQSPDYKSPSPSGLSLLLGHGC